jgi:hypothetical protein
MRLADYDEREQAGPLVRKLMTFKEAAAQAFLASEHRAERLAREGRPSIRRHAGGNASRRKGEAERHSWVNGKRL